jgi:hypothetical protein
VCAQSHNHRDRYYLYAAFFSTSIFIMPVTPNIPVLRVLDKWPFSTRSRDERRLRSRRNVSQLRTPTSAPTSFAPGQTIYLGGTPVTIVNNDPSELNIQSQQSLYLAPGPSQSTLYRLRHKTSKWFADKCAAKGMSTISGSSYTILFFSLNRVLMRFRRSSSQSICNTRLTCLKGSEPDHEPPPSNQSPSRKSR